MTDIPARTIEERVAALEEQAANPVMFRPPDWEPLTGPQEAELRESLGEAVRLGGYRVLPPAPLLTPETARELLRECVTVVHPGETLIVRADENWSPRQVHEVQEYADGVAEYRELGVKILFLPGEEFAVAKAAAE